MTMTKDEIFSALGLDIEGSGVYAGGWLDPSGGVLEVENPARAEVVARVHQASEHDYERVVESSQETFERWRVYPAPKRGEFVREIGNALRKHKEALGALIALENGKIAAEGEGEVQEMIDIADFAVGLSRQLYGLTMASERPEHRMFEQWHPLGPVGVITAFNFPAAVWSWNALIGAVCGDTIVWKPSSKTPLTAIAITRIVESVMEGSGFEGVFNLVVGRGREVGDRLINDRRFPLISATGSCAMGEKVGVAVAARLGRSLLELGGNNAVIVLDDADPEMVTRAVLFGAVGTAGQRCTSIRRMIVEPGIKTEVVDRLVEAYRQVRIGDPLDPDTLMGPLIDEQAVHTMLTAVSEAERQGGKVLVGGSAVEVEGLEGYFVEPTIIEIGRDAPIVQEETFAPILYVIEAEGVEDAISVQNGVRQGLSSAIFTNSLRDAETFLSPAGS
ncbi:MAG: aldehyde dehydrogenase family protein, partial [Acidimicrobiia bacterium]|nr:aldehyde dehydrogenase family protein [Acidimicrobiia bacterium]